MNNLNSAYSIFYNKRWREVFAYAGIATLCYVLKCIIFYVTPSPYSDVQFTLLAGIPYIGHALLILNEFRKMNLDAQHAVLPRMLAKTVSSESPANEKLINWWKLDDQEEINNTIIKKRNWWILLSGIFELCGFIVLIFIKELNFKWLYIIPPFVLIILGICINIITIRQTKKLVVKKENAYIDALSLFPNELVNETFLREKREEQALVLQQERLQRYERMEGKNDIR